MSLLTLQVAGLPLALELSGSTVNEQVRRRYRGFLSPEKPDFRLSVTRRRGEPRSADPMVRGGGDLLTCAAERFGWSLDLKGGRGRARLDALKAQDIDSLLRTLYASLLPREGASLYHAAALAFGGNASIFVGASGAGKTTLSRHLSRLKGVRVLSDELAAVLKTSEGFKACSTPFWGEFRMPTNNGSRPLAQVIFLEKALPGEKSLTRVPPPLAQRRLWKCLVSFENSRKSLEDSWDRMLEMLCYAPAFVLRWNKSEPPAELAERIWPKTGRTA